MLCQKTGRRMLRHSLPMRGHARRSLAVCVVALAACAVVPVATEAATGTATISAGTLGFASTPPNVGFSATLNAPTRR